MCLFKKYRKFLVVLSVVSAIILILFYNALLPVKKLPVYQPAMVNFELVDSTIQHQKKFHRIADFSLTNQNGKTITQNNFGGKIYVADFFLPLVPPSV
jgi:protein SCO1/2